MGKVSVGKERGNMIIVKQSMRMRRMEPKFAAASRNPREFFVWNCFAQEGVGYCIWASAFIICFGISLKSRMHKKVCVQPYQHPAHGGAKMDES